MVNATIRRRFGQKLEVFLVDRSRVEGQKTTLGAKNDASWTTSSRNMGQMTLKFGRNARLCSMNQMQQPKGELTIKNLSPAVKNNQKVRQKMEKRPKIVYEVVFLLTATSDQPQTLHKSHK